MAKRPKFKSVISAVTVMLCVAVTVICFISVDNDLLKLRLRQEKIDNRDFVRFIDVGQGDSILIYSNGYSALLDTGPYDRAEDLSLSLREAGVESVDVLILSHLHTDHTGGVEQIFADFPVETLILPELSTFSEGIYSAELAIDKVTRSAGQVFKAVEGMGFEIGDFKVTVIGAYYDIFEENNRSLIIKAEIDGKSFLLMGDAEGYTEKKLLEDKKDLKSDVLKVGHHGSSTSTTADFLKAVDPQYAVISAGEGNQYNHPHMATVKQLEMYGTKTFRTDFRGDITFHVNKGEIKVETKH